jgi:hypothetical protein
VVLACLVAGCAGGHARAHPAPAAPPPAGAPSSTPPSGAPAKGTPTTAPGGGPIAAPWDTAATANGRAGQRSHLYPSGVSAVGKRLVVSLPDPQGVSVEETPAPASPAPAAPAAPAPPAATPAPGIGGSGCWEVQLLVTSDRGRADALKKRIEKDLDLAAWVKGSNGLYRVRAGGCLSPDGAYELAQTLKGKGFPEAFRVMRDAP